MKISFAALILVITCFVKAQEVSFENRIVDVSDWVAVEGKGFQIQAGVKFEKFDEESALSSSWSIPDFRYRYIVHDRFAVQGTLNYDFQKFDLEGSNDDSNSQFNNFSLGLISELNPDFKLWVFDQFSILWENFIPLRSEERYGSNLGLNWSTELNERFELDYRLGYSYKNQLNDRGYYSLELDIYVTPKILLEVGDEGNWGWKKEDEFEHDLVLKLKFMSEKKHQFNLRMDKTWGKSHYAIIARYVKTFGGKQTKLD